MNFFDRIRSWFNYATQLFVNLALESYSSWYIPDVMGDLFNGLSTFTARVSGYFYDASNWYDWVIDEVSEILSWSTIWSYIQYYIPNWNKIGQWFSGWGSYVLSIINAWWSQRWLEIQGYVDSIMDTLPSLPDLSAILDWFASWTANVLTTVNTWWQGKLLDIESLINSAFLARDSLWSGWQELRSQVSEFFSDPEDWLYKAVDRIVERFW